MIRPSLVIPVGRLAMDALIGSRPLDDVIGKEHSVTDEAGHRSVAVPLPHPSGASSWIHTGNHRQLLDRALELISQHWARIEGRRVA